MLTPNKFQDLIGYSLGSQQVSITAKDAIIYAIACGASYKELDLVYEKDLKVLPGIVSTLGLWAVEKCGDLGVYDRKKSLHVSQKIVIKREVEVDKKISMSAKVENVWDRGNATIVDILVESECFDASYSIFIPGCGGWGGQPPESSQKMSFDYVQADDYQTSDNQAVLYRLTGDLHPVHVDFDVAKKYGFEKPILHGLCTYGIALRMLAKFAKKSPSFIKMARGKLTSPVLPGDNLSLHVAEVDGGYAFEVRVAEKLVLRDGFAEI